MRRIMLLLALLTLLLGCSSPAPAPAPAPAPEAPAREALTPAQSGLFLDLSVPEAVPGGEVWLATNHVPPEVLHRWRVGLTDSEGKEHLLGRLTEAPNYKVPQGAAPGEGQVWISTSERSGSAGTISVRVTLQPAYERYASEALGLSFAVPTGWRLYDEGANLRLERTAERAATPVESILITHCAEGGCQPSEGEELMGEAERWVGGRWLPFRSVRRCTRSETRCWEELHLTFPTVDLQLAYRPERQPGVTELFLALAESLHFIGEAIPPQQITACAALLAEVQIGAPWAEREAGDCFVRYAQPESGIELSVSELRDGLRPLIEATPVTLSGESNEYPALLGRVQPRQGAVDPTPPPTIWGLRVAGARGAILLTCTAPPVHQYARSCPRILSLTPIGNLGKPVLPLTQ